MSIAEPARAEMAERLLIRRGNVLDVAIGSYTEAADVLIDGGLVSEVGVNLEAPGARVLDAAGLIVMPGLIDSHVHLTAMCADLGMLTAMAPSYITAHAIRIMSGMLSRGFTTVRDAGGADYGLAKAQRDGVIRGPRILYCGRALSQTGGHGDFRAIGQSSLRPEDDAPGIGRVVDGVDSIRVAAREELRKGADFLKVMASGGVASPTDHIASTQYAVTELEAVVEEAAAANRYVAAHAYTARAANRALTAGVRSIEHGNLIDETSIKLFATSDAFLVPTLVTYWALKKAGLEQGLPRRSWEKLDSVLDAGLEALQLAARAGVRIAFGTDLLGDMHAYQSHEFRIRSQVQPLLSVIQSATSVAADLIGMSGRLGCVTPGAFADLLVLDADPLTNVEVLADPAQHLRWVVQAGRIVVKKVP